jgi:hypothetical protein
MQDRRDRDDGGNLDFDGQAFGHKRVRLAQARAFYCEICLNGHADWHVRPVFSGPFAVQELPALPQIIVANSYFLANI